MQVAIALTGRYLVHRRFVVPRPAAVTAFAATVLVAVVVALAAGLPGYLSDRWHDFRSPTPPAATGVQRLDSFSGSGRYQNWNAAIDANATNPLIGIGPGTYEYWWAQHRTIPLSVVNAHSLYLESFGELGIIGLLLIVGVVGLPLAAGTVKSVQARGNPDRAALFAGSVAALAAFAAAAAIDWVWQLPAIVAAFLLLSVAVLTGGVRTAAPRSEAALAPRLILVAAALAGLIAVGLPLGGTQAVRASQAEVRSKDLGAALEDARTAHSIQPYSASASLQEALVLELQGRLPQAVAAAKQATQESATNWQNWIVLSRLEAENGDASASLDAYRKAKALNPLSPVFNQ
jgi:cytochrome c-type biogenesis protein CcmH/NrfG